MRPKAPFVAIALLSAVCLAEEPVSDSKRPVVSDVIGIGLLTGHPKSMEMLERNGFMITEETAFRIHEFYDPQGLVTESDMSELDKRIERIADELADVSPAEWQVRMDHVLAPLRKSMARPLVTTDSLLHAYSTIFNDALRSLERRQAGRLRDWQAYLAKETDSLRENPGLLGRDEVRRLAGLIAVGRKLLEPDWKPGNDDLPGWVAEEVERVTCAEGGSRTSEAWDRKIDYSVFKPRGFYAGDKELEAYFRARTWWSRFPLRLKNDTELRMAAELAKCSTVEEYVHLARPYDDLLGRSEDPDLRDLDRAMYAVLGRELEGHEQDRDNRLSAAVEILKGQFHPRIRTVENIRQRTKEGEVIGIFILPPKYVFGSEVFTLTTSGILVSRLPKGLDLMAALGGDSAQRLLMAETPAELREPLGAGISIARGRLKGNRLISETTVLTHRVFEALINHRPGPRHPWFMKTDAYQRKSLQTALAGWAEHRHRWVLHAKYSDDCMDVITAPAGFVEPNLEFWQRLLDLAVATRTCLSKYDSATDRRWDDLMLTLVRCRLIAEKQLVGEGLSERDTEFFAEFSETLKALCEHEVHDYFEGPPQAVVADVHRRLDTGQIVHVGTGLCQAMYAIIPYKGRNWLCKGGVMTYREYVTLNVRLSDEVWARKLISSPESVPQPKWTKGFCLPPVIETDELGPDASE